MKQTLLIFVCSLVLSSISASAQEILARPDRNLQPPSIMDPAVDPCRYFTADEPMAGFFIEMEHEERLVPMRVPKRYLEDRFDHTEGAKHGTQLFSIEVPTFEPITRRETGRRNAAALPWDWMHFVVTDQLPLDETIGKALQLPLSVEDIGKPRTDPNWRDFPSDTGPHGLTSIIAPDRLRGEDLFIHQDGDGGLAGWMLCGVHGINNTLNEGCSYTTRLSEMDVRMNFRRTELANWNEIYNNIALFLTCATSKNL